MLLHDNLLVNSQSSYFRFRWVQCQLTTLKQCVTAVRIRKALNNLPKDLDATYERILLGINRDEEGDVVRRALEWLVAAFQPMQLSQFMESLSIDLGRRVLDYEFRPVHGPALLDALGSLVAYDELTDIVILSHFSVKVCSVLRTICNLTFWQEYLVGEFTRTKYPQYHINEQAAHTQLALLCMCYISACIKCSRLPIDIGYEGHPNSTSPPSDFHPLLEYVQPYGFHHLRYVKHRSRVTFRAIETLQLDVERHPADWERLCERSYSAGLEPPWPSLKHDLVLYILIAFAPEPLLRSYIGRSKLKLKDETNPLIYAARFCKVEHARTLLSNGVSLNSRGWNVGPNPLQVLPLQVAVDSEYDLPPLMIVDLFLKEGSPVPCELFASAIEERIAWLPASIVAKLLLVDQFAEWAVNVQSEELLRAGYAPRYSEFFPYFASHEDIIAIQQRLVQIGCDTSSAHMSETSLRHAASAGHLSAVQRILSSNTPMPPDIILDASRSRTSNSELIRFFLDRGCDIDAVSTTGDTAFHFVLRSRPPDCLESIQLLVDAGCNPSACNLVGETPLHLAASLGYLSVVVYLLSQHVPLPPDILLFQIPEPDTPSLVKSHLPMAPTILFLISKDVDMNVLSADGSTPMHLLLANPTIEADERLRCTKVLIDAGCNPCLPNAFGETAFDVAARDGLLPVVEYLFSLNFLPSPTVLLSVSSSTHVADATIKFLINNGSDIHVSDANGDTVLHLSMMADVEEVQHLRRIKIFINAGCDARACNIAGETPFHVAAKQRLISVMEYLIFAGISIPPDIMLAALKFQYDSRSCYPTIRFLLERGCDASIVTEDGDSLLHLAAMLYAEEEEAL